jgi:hypothetical protein
MFSSIMARTILANDLGRSRNGAVAQLGERMTGSHEVRGSIPLGSTNQSKISNIGKRLFCERGASKDSAPYFVPDISSSFASDHPRVSAIV